MAAPSADTLLNEARCYECNTSNGYGLELMKLAVLRRILLAMDPTAVTDPSTLLNEARCYECSGANGYMLLLMELALLNRLVDSATALSGNVTCGTGAPTVAPASGCGLYVQTDSVPAGVIWQYYGGAWH